MLLLLWGSRDKSHGSGPWAGSSRVGKAWQGFAWLRDRGRGQEHSRSLNEPPRFSTRFRPRVLCKGKRRACCGYHTSEALGKLLQEKGELPVPVGPHHPVLSASLLCGLCLPYPGDSAFTSHITRVTLRTILYLHCRCQISLTPGLCLLWSLPFPRRASPMFVYDWSRSPGQPHPANIPQPPAKRPAPLPMKTMSAIPSLSRELQHLLVTRSFPRHQSPHQAQQTSSSTVCS